MSLAGAAGTHTAAPTRFPGIAPALQTTGFSLVAAALQWKSGAYSSEFSGYPDEPAHVVTSIGTERYVAHGFPGGPVQFFSNYYLHFPKIAMGHWPPLLYIVHALPMLATGPRRETFLAVQALLAGILAYLVFRWLRDRVGAMAAALGAVSFLAVPVVQTHTSMVMAEILLTLTMILACRSFARFLETEAIGDVAWFGVWTTAAILTKGTGWALGLVAAAALLLARRWEILANRVLWLAAIPVVLLAVPWQIATRHLATLGFDASLRSRYIAYAVPGLLKILWTLPGIGIAILAAAAIVDRVLMRKAQPLVATMAALVFSDVVFHVMVPAGVEERKLIMAVPAMFVLAGFGAVTLAMRFAASRKNIVAAWIFGLAALSTLATSLPVVQKPALGFRESAAALASRIPDGSAALVSSDGTGEGAFISEFALIQPDPRIYIVRESKLLTELDWSGKDFELKVHNPEECNRLLDSVPVSFVVADLNPRLDRTDFRVLREAVEDRAKWTLLGKYSPPSGHGSVAIYERAAGPAPVRKLVIDMNRSLGRELKMVH